MDPRGPAPEPDPDDDVLQALGRLLSEDLSEDLAAQAKAAEDEAARRRAEGLPATPTVDETPGAGMSTLPARISDIDPTTFQRARVLGTPGQPDGNGGPRPPATPPSPFGTGEGAPTEGLTPEERAFALPPRPPPPPPPDTPNPAFAPPPPEGPKSEPLVDRFAPPPTSTERMFKSVPPREESEPGRRFGGFRMSLATLLRQRRRILLSTIIVALGVAYLAGSLSLLHRVDSGLADLSGAGTERADLVVEGTISFDSPLEQVRNLIPDGLAPAIEAIDGVAAVDPRVEDTVVIVAPNGEAIVPLGITERPAGANWPTVESLSPYTFVGDGAPPTNDTEIVIDSSSAERAGVAVGDQVGAQTRTFGIYTVVGIVDVEGTPLPPGSSLALFDLDTARKLFDRPSEDNAIGVAIEPGADVDAVKADIQAITPPLVEVSTPAEYEQHRQTSLAKSFTLIEVLLLAFAALAVIVGAFTVANSNALLFARRRHGFALLRLVGATPRQLLTAALAEAGLVGILAVIVGLPLGLLAGAAIERTLGALGSAIPTAGSPISLTMLAVSAAVGLAVTVITAIAPAWDAARAAPVAALNRSDENTGVGISPIVRVLAWTMVGALIGAVAGAALVGGTTAILIGAGAGAASLALFLLLPWTLSGLVAWATRVMVGPSRALRSLTALRSRRARSRAASTTAALLIATLVIALLSTLSASFVASIAGQVDRLVTADLVVDSGTFTRGGLPEDLIGELRQTEGVSTATGIRLGRAYIDNVPWRFSAIEGDSVFEVLDLGMDSHPAELGEDEILLSESFASSLGVGVGSTVGLDFSGAFEDVTVVGLYPEDSPLIGDGIVGADLVRRNLPTSVDLLALVELDTPGDPAATQRVEETAAAFGISRVDTPEELVDQRADLLRGFQRVIEWMLLFSVALAVIGVANTLQLSVNERRRELGLLRAVGASRRQVIRIVMVEAGALSIVGSILGSLIGVGLAFAAVQGLSGLGLDTLEIPYVTVGATALAAIILGLSGAVLPAWRASGAGILDAIGEDDGSEPTLLGRISRFRIRRRSRSLTEGPQRANRVYRAPRPEPAQPVEAVESELAPEETMTARCYNCGNDPGNSDRCEVCDASQIPEPMGMFSTAPAAPGEHASAARSGVAPSAARRTAGLWSTGDGDDEPADSRLQNGQNGNGRSTDDRFADIVDAAVIDDDDEDDYLDPPTAHEPAAEHEAPRGTPLGSIFDDDTLVSSPSGRSPFGQHANDEPGDAEWAANDPAARAGATQAPPQQPSYQVPPPSYPPQPQPQPHNPYAPPVYGAPAAPYYQTAPLHATPTAADPFAQAGVGAPPAGNGAIPITPDPQGLAAAISKLSPQAQHVGNVGFSVVGGIIAADEVVLAGIQGWALGMPTVAVLTSSRVLVVSERRWKPLVEVFPLRPGLTIFGRHIDNQASVTFQEGDRVVTLDQVIDVAVAVELATTARARSTGTGF